MHLNPNHPSTPRTDSLHVVGSILDAIIRLLIQLQIIKRSALCELEVHKQFPLESSTGLFLNISTSLRPEEIHNELAAGLLGDGMITSLVLLWSVTSLDRKMTPTLGF
jgi:hypothetical protein